MLRMILLSVLLVPGLVFAGHSQDEDRLRARIPGIFSDAAAQYKMMAQELAKSPGKAPWRPEKDGSLRVGALEGWTSGFYPGSLWYIYEGTGDPEIKALAERQTAYMERLRHFNEHHDIGFMMNCSAGNAYRITGEEKYADWLRDAAVALAGRYSSDMRLLKSWSTKEWCGFRLDFPVIIDTMMNLELLEWASKHGGPSKLEAIARAHADTTDARHFRKDGSVYHLVNYNERTGGIYAIYAGQGASVDGCWARGQAWAIYGYTVMYRMTREPRYLDRAVQSADWFMSAKTLPEDGVPYWDFSRPGESRDASAAAITASALLELATFASPEKSRAYRGFAVRQLDSLSSPDYRAKVGENCHFLLMHSTGNAPNNSEVDTALPYADYYFLEGLRRFATINRP